VTAGTGICSDWLDVVGDLFAFDCGRHAITADLDDATCRGLQMQLRAKGWRKESGGGRDGRAHFADNVRMMRLGFV
jgi:hypothetical protein